MRETTSWWEVLGFVNLLVYTFLRMTLVSVTLIVILYNSVVILEIDPYVGWLLSIYMIAFIAIEFYRLLFVERDRYVPNILHLKNNINNKDKQKGN